MILHAGGAVGPESMSYNLGLQEEKTRMEKNVLLGARHGGTVGANAGRPVQARATVTLHEGGGAKTSGIKLGSTIKSKT